VRSVALLGFGTVASPIQGVEAAVRFFEQSNTIVVVRFEARINAGREALEGGRAEEVR